jgi:hypothetical protein
MPYNIILNSSNLIGINNSQFKYYFINGNFTINEGAEICVSQIVIPYSWFNISQSFYKNATIQYYFPNGSTSNLYTIIFPDGFYSVSDLNNYIQLYMISQNQYFYNQTSLENLYYIQIIQNTTYYSNQIILNPVPTTLPNGYSLPTTIYNGFTYSGFNCNNTTGGTSGSTYSFYPTISTTGQIVIPTYVSYYGIGSILGFKSGIYPTSSSLISINILSNRTPNATPVNSLIVRCDLINNECSMPTNILDAVPITSTFGSNITYIPSYEKWISIQEGTFNNLTIYIEDQNFNTLNANDPNILISLILKQGPKKKLKLPIYKNVSNSIIKHIEFNDEK